MDELIVTCAQQQIRVFENHHPFRSDVQRFMRQAKLKESHLVIFPELSGLLLVPPLAPGLKRALLKMAERQVKKSPSFLDRMIGRAADSAVGAIGGIGKDIANAILQHESTLRDAYLTIFSETAREYGMYILGGSIYLPDAGDGQIHNTAFLFGPTGDVVGWQAKVMLNATDRQFCQPAKEGWKTLATDFGPLGILIGEDVLYPESGRILAQSGALAVASILATVSHSTFLKARQALAARLEENLLLGAQSCLVGKNILGLNEPDFVGRSSIFAPIEMTSRYAGVLGEVGSMVTESVVSSMWDINGLLELRRAARTSAHVIPSDRALRDQIRQVYGLVEEARPAPTLFAAPPAAPQPPPIEPAPAPPEEWPGWPIEAQEEPWAGEPVVTPTAAPQPPPIELVPAPPEEWPGWVGEALEEPWAGEPVEAEHVSALDREEAEEPAAAPFDWDLEEAVSEDGEETGEEASFYQERGAHVETEWPAMEDLAPEGTTEAWPSEPPEIEQVEADEFSGSAAAAPADAGLPVDLEAEAEEEDPNTFRTLWEDSEDSERKPEDES